MDSWRIFSTGNDSFRNNPASDRIISLISRRLSWALSTCLKIRSRPDFCRSVKGPFRSVFPRRLVVLTEITDSGPVRAWIRRSKRRSFPVGFLACLGFFFSEIFLLKRYRPTIVYPLAGKETQKVVYPEDRQSSGFSQGGHAEIL